MTGQSISLLNYIGILNYFKILHYGLMSLETTIYIDFYAGIRSLIKLVIIKNRK